MVSGGIISHNVSYVNTLLFITYSGKLAAILGGGGHMNLAFEKGIV
jgi:hypothetical protein